MRELYGADGPAAMEKSEAGCAKRPKKSNCGVAIGPRGSKFPAPLVRVNRPQIDLVYGNSK